MWQRGSPVPAQMWQRGSPVPAQMWQRGSPVPAQMRQRARRFGARLVHSAVRCLSDGTDGHPNFSGYPRGTLRVPSRYSPGTLKALHERSKGDPRALPGALSGYSEGTPRAVLRRAPARQRRPQAADASQPQRSLRAAVRRGGEQHLRAQEWAGGRTECIRAAGLRERGGRTAASAEPRAVLAPRIRVPGGARFLLDKGAWGSPFPCGRRRRPGCVGRPLTRPGGWASLVGGRAGGEGGEGAAGHRGGLCGRGRRGALRYECGAACGRHRRWPDASGRVRGTDERRPSRRRPMRASPGGDVRESRRRCGRVPARHGGV